MTDNRRAIIDNMITVLSGINGESPYDVEVASVGRFFRTWTEQASVKELPTIGLASGPITTQYQHSSQIRVSARFYLWCHVRGDDEDTRLATIDGLIDDIIYSLSLDQRRGGYATSTTIAGWETDEADESRGNSLSMRVDVDVVYFRNTGKS